MNLIYQNMPFDLTCSFSARTDKSHRILISSFYELYIQLYLAVPDSFLLTLMHTLVLSSTYYCACSEHFYSCLTWSKHQNEYFHFKISLLKQNRAIEPPMPYVFI
ncbi:hypothetical protein VCUG_01758 [Vavraia culicis subsp. floridensis]|uniref:Uncharacterized protein n=1 Tax=Vavraia culicis (isolate floridensis) TaxID=948595 RepID=L2GTN8_VAVCU|nr:uncharacterized protein VCUG_01758 [Vavraia culicis subsp. floridensis]ELA46732.1 hypothetical protein VCUG_01758 [Vavraia culicis subsp. floridensis]